MAKPTYKITIDPEFSDGEDLGWAATAFTNRPAIIIKGTAFRAAKQREEMFFADKLKYRIAAPAMIPMEIYRNDEDGEYYVEFTAKEIERIHKKFMKNLGKNKNLFNLEHDNSEIVPAYILEVLLIDTQAKVEMILSDYGIKIPVGTLFMIAQITDKEYYNQLVENGQTGFSIEGFLGLSLKDFAKQEEYKINKNSKMEEKVMLPEGAEFQIGEKWYIVKDGVISEKVSEEVALEDEPEKEKVDEVEAAEEVVEEKVDEVEAAEEVVEEKIEEEVALEKDEEIIEEELAEEAPVSDSYSKEEVDAKFDEIYKMIAELKPEEVIEEDVVEEVELSVHDRLSAFTAFSKKNK